MTTASRIAEVAAADAFLAAPKTLDGPFPIWANSRWGGEYAAVWIILDGDGAPAAQLKFTARKADTSNASANLIWRGRTLWRVDMDSQRHPNPPDAWTMNLPAIVAGPHEHAWDINRRHVLTQDVWDLPYRRLLPPGVHRVGQGFLWLADRIKIKIEHEQRGFEGPTKAELFD